MRCGEKLFGSNDAGVVYASKVKAYFSIAKICLYNMFAFAMERKCLAQLRLMRKIFSTTIFTLGDCLMSLSMLIRKELTRNIPNKITRTFA